MRKMEEHYKGQDEGIVQGKKTNPDSVKNWKLENRK
jgi:hypothetical protein